MRHLSDKLIERKPKVNKTGMIQAGKEKELHKTEINCFSCQFFFITYTYNPNFPYGCRGAGFKSREMPSQAMYVNSGMDCLLYTKKEKSQRS